MAKADFGPVAVQKKGFNGGRMTNAAVGRCRKEFDRDVAEGSIATAQPVSHCHQREKT